jgi:hypothetical protein
MATTFLPVPDPSEPLNVGGKMNPIWYAYYEQLTAYANTSLNAINNFDVWAPWVVKFPEAETVKLGMACPFGWTIAQCLLETEVGTVTVQLVVDGVAVDVPMDASTVRSTHTIDGGVVASGEDISFTFSSPSSDCENLSISLVGIRSFG